MGKWLRAIREEAKNLPRDYLLILAFIGAVVVILGVWAVFDF